MSAGEFSPGGFPLALGKTLLKTVANPAAVLITRVGDQMRQRTLTFADEQAALTWCLQKRANLLLLQPEPSTTAN